MFAVPRDGISLGGRLERLRSHWPGSWASEAVTPNQEWRRTNDPWDYRIADRRGDRVVPGEGRGPRRNRRPDCADSAGPARVGTDLAVSGGPRSAAPTNG